MSALGINSNDSIYLYDAKGNVDASRLWWMLKLYGFDKVALIDGGFIQWRLKGFPVNEDLEFFEQASFILSDESTLNILASKDEVHFGRFEQIIDARSLEEYKGEIMKNGAVRGGHIPGAVRLDYTEVLDGGSFRFKSKEKMLRLLDSKGLSADKSTVVYCHSGVRSSLVAFVLTEIVGMQHVYNYDGSWIEWSQDESLPISNE